MIHERMADNGTQFALSLHQMHEDLLELVGQLERNRKHWKTTGLAAEQRVADCEAAMRKSKAKYDSLADDYDRARTGDRQAGKKFGLKGPKSAAQHEEDLLRKVQAADADYSQKVQIAQRERAELWSKLRPEAVKAVEDLIKECDSALTLQMQKFGKSAALTRETCANWHLASFNEKLLLSNGLNISPIKGNEGTNQPRSLREAVYAIDNEKDFSNYISSYGSKVPPRTSEIKYERNPVSCADKFRSAIADLKLRFSIPHNLLLLLPSVNRIQQRPMPLAKALLKVLPKALALSLPSLPLRPI